MKAKCCRSLPRCASCPVLLMARARRERDLEGTAALVESVLASPGPQMPRCVEEALTQLEAARVAARARPVLAASR